MLTQTELQELVKRRRDVQDLDLEWYLKVKSDILNLLLEVKNNLNDYSDILTPTRINELRDNLKLAKAKVELSLNYDIAKYTITSKDSENYETDLREFLSKCLSELTSEFEIVNKKIKYVKDILYKRNSINNTIMEYLEKAKVIKLTEDEIKSLFENDVSDLSVIFSSGKLISEDKLNKGNNVYEFKFSKEGSFNLSIDELKSKIERQIADCEQIEENIAKSQNLWKTSSVNLVELLNKIEEQIVI